MPVLNQESAVAPSPVSDDPAGGKSWRMHTSWVLDRIGPLIGLIVVFGMFAILRPNTFLAVDNLQIMLRQTAVVGTAALGMTVIIIAGGIDLSVGANIALCTVVIAKVLNAGYSPVIAGSAGIGAGALCGLLTGSLVTGLDLIPFIVTLGLWGSVRGFAKWFSENTQVEAPATWLNGILESLSPEQSWMIFPPGVWVMFALTLFVGAILRYTRFGRHAFAIGSNEQTARLCGVRVKRTKVLIYVFAGAMAGVAGLLEFSRLTVGDPITANGAELNIIAACVIGGTSLNGGQGGVFGTLVGALIMTVVANGCNKVELSNAIQEIVTGGIIVLAVVLDRFRHRNAG